MLEQDESTGMLPPYWSAGVKLPTDHYHFSPTMIAIILSQLLHIDTQAE